ncbi:MAG: sigma-54-dependent Fis family transcriptional regulator [Candidatus Firestonebacteria bacterium]|nr:sigma-54-dependent Fis family transcriptional regulator [Candidatus Firestonebacteria bacterium]
MPRILILDDEIEMVGILTDILEARHFVTEHALLRQEVMPKLEAFVPDLITLDLKFGEGGEKIGLEILSEIRSRFAMNELPIIAISGTGDAFTLAELYKMGLNDYFSKPITDRNELVKKIQYYLDLSLQAKQQVPPPATSVVVGKSPAVMNLVSQIAKIASQELDVLFEGETGTGKSHLAELYYQLSPRRDRKFYTVDLATPTHTLFEAEIFGHERDSFTGARFKKGKAEEAQDGILFLDEIGELDLHLQVKLLSLIQHRTITRIGENHPLKLNLVILAATSRNLPAMVKAGTFRAELYHRLSMRVQVPALREHSEDIPELVYHLIRRHQKINPIIKKIDDETLSRFMLLSWPGNVRQLENCIKNGMSKGQSEVLTWRDFEGYLALTPEDETLDNTFGGNYYQMKDRLQKRNDEIESRYILQQLQKHCFNVPDTAQAIGLKNRQQLNQIIKRLGIKMKRE